jgi:hypothetical protein
MKRYVAIKVLPETQEMIRRIAAIQERDIAVVVRLMAQAELERYARHMEHGRTGNGATAADTAAQGESR